MSCSEWKESKLGEISLKITKGSTPTTLDSEFSDKGIKFYRSECLTDSRIIDKNKAKYISKETYDKMKRSQLFENDILFSMAGAYLGKTSIVMKDDIPANINQAVAIIRPDCESISYRYLYYYLNQKRVVEYVNNISSQSAQPNINLKQIGEIPIKYPKLEEQEKIADVLSFLDDKIELNNEMNKTLEEMAQSIFKRWFVDFEFPNEDGQPYKSSGGEMVESELGMIPKDWEVKRISELIEVKDGTHASPKVSKEGYPLVTSKHIKGDRIAIEDTKLISEKDYLEVNKRSKVDTGDILISMIGTVGLTYLVQDDDINFAIKNIGLFKTSENTTLSEYIYLYLNSQNMKNYIEARLAGTTQKYISLGELRNIPIVFNDNVISMFKDISRVLLDKKRSNILENEHIKNIRDSLLSKLMSEEVKFN